MDKHLPSESSAVERRHEHADIAPGPILKSGIVFVVIMLIGMGAIYLMFQSLSARETASEQADPSIFTQADVAPKPNLQVNEKGDYKQFSERAHQQLNSYGWVDQANGVARIPIERAMDLIVERGLPVREQGQ